MGLPHEARPTKPPLVTLSGGVSCWTPASAVSVTELLSQADKALFRAKTAGRDRIEVAVPTPDEELEPVPVAL
jgi:PleD family two-component response regulator